MVDTNLRLQHGRISTEVTPMTGTAAHFSVETPGTVSTVRGTHFRVGSDAGQSQTEVLKGSVNVSGGHSHVLVQKGLGVASVDGHGPDHAHALLPAPSLHCASQPINPVPNAVSWAALDLAKSYRVQVAPNSHFTTLLVDNITNENLVILSDLPDGDYAVRVHGIDADQMEGQDSVCAMHLNGHPQPPLVIEPLPDSKVRDTRPRFQWTQSLQAVSYAWQLASDKEFAHTLADVPSVTSDKIRAPQLLPYGRYYWRVASRDEKGKQGPFSGAIPFELIPQPVAAEVGQPKSSKGEVTFAWTAGASGQHYHIQLDRHADFGHPKIDQTLEQPSIQISKPGSGTWYVRMQTIDTDGYAGPWGETQKIRLSCLACRIAAISSGGALLWLLL